MMQQGQRFEVLDSFRGLCALFVVFYHLHVAGSVTELAFFRGSSVFVEFFFVLSGFVLAHGYAFRPDLAFGPYFRARLLRLYPLHLFMLLLFILLELGKWAAMEGFGISLNNAAFSNDYAPEGILPNLLLLHAWTPFTNPLSFNTPSWSISIELYMYLLLFLTLMLPRALRLLTWLLIPLAMFHLMMTGSDLLVSPVMRGLSGFFGGVLCYLLYRRFGAKLQPPKAVASLVEGALLLAVVGVVQSNTENRAVLATLLFCVVVFWFALERGQLSAWFRRPQLQALGRLSYSIYMTHAAVIYLFTSMFLVLQKVSGLPLMTSVAGVRYFDTGNFLANHLLIAAVLASVILASRWTCRHIEERGRRLGVYLSWSDRPAMFARKRRLSQPS